MRYGQRTRVTSQTSDWVTGASWTPYSLRNLVAWWDASMASTFTFSSGTVVSQWDSVVGGYAMVQATGAKQPSRSGTLNGLDTVVFDGSNHAMATSTTFDMTGSQTISVWAVFTAASGGDQCIVEQTTNFNSNAGAWNVFRVASNVFSFAKRASSTYSTADSIDTVTSTAKACIASHNGTLASIESQVFVNLDLRQTVLVNGNTDSSNLNQTLYMGGRGATSLYLNGTIAEVGICTSVFTLDEVVLLNDYLRAKWAI